MRNSRLVTSLALAAGLLFAATARGEIIVLVCALSSTDPAEASVPLEKTMTVDLERKLVDGHPARITPREIAYDVPGPAPGEIVTTAVSRQGGSVSVTSSLAGTLFTGRCGKAAQTGF
jgi:hypothetical protein